MLKAALVQMIRRDGETFGQKEIEDAGKILRTLWCEVGTQAFAEWVRRTFVFLQSEEILFFEMCQYCSWTEKENLCDNEPENKQTESTCKHSCFSLRTLWESGLYRSSSQGWESFKQLCGELDKIVQELSCSATPKESFLQCLRATSESEESLREALSTISQGNVGENDRKKQKENKQPVGINGDKAATIDASYYKGCRMRQGIEREVIAFAQNQRDEVRDLADKAGALQAEPGMKQQTFVAEGFDRYNQCSTGNIAETLRTPGGGDNYSVVCVGESYTFEPGILKREGGHIYESVAGTLRANAGDNQLSTAYGITVKGNGEAFVSKETHATLAAGGGQAGQGYPCVVVKDDKNNELSIVCMATQQGGAEVRTDDKAPCLTASAGMSGNNQPVIAYSFDSLGSNSIEQKVINLNKDDFQSKQVLDPQGIAPAIYAGECRGGGGECYIVDKIVDEKSDLCLIDSIGGQAEKGWVGETAPCLKATHYKSPISIAYASDCKCYDARGNGDGEIANTLTGDHENRITDYTVVAVERCEEAPSVNSVIFDGANITSPTKQSNPQVGDPCHTLSTDSRNYVVNCYDLGEARLRTPSEYIEKSPTLTARCGTGGNNVPGLVYCLQGNGIDRADTAGCNGKGWKEDASYTLNTIDRPAVVYAVDQGGGKSSVSVCNDVSPTLCTTHQGEPAVAYVANGGNVVGTLTASQGQKLWLGNQEAFSGEYHIVEEVSEKELECARDFKGIGNEYVAEGKCIIEKQNIEGKVIAMDRASFNQGTNAKYDFEISDKGVNSTLVAKGPSAVAYWDGSQVAGTLTKNNAGGNQRMPDKENFNCIIENKGEEAKVIRTHYIVRRLTPTECARLQGFPDTWGHIDHKEDFTDDEYKFWLEVRNTYAAINDKQVKEYTKQQMLTWYNKLHTDSAEYKMWGNGISLPNALYVMQGIADAMNSKN